jgi:hypothetical protein
VVNFNNCLMPCDAMLSSKLLWNFRMNLVPPSSGYKLRPQVKLFCLSVIITDCEVRHSKFAFLYTPPCKPM